jgi:Ca2+:H+ antiporter
MFGLTRIELVVLGAIAFFSAAAGVARYRGVTPLLAFGVATLALAGLAWIVSFATEQVGERLGPAATGVLQSTLGNLPEFFVVVFALSAGKTVVAQTAIVGSILANALLVLGLAIIAGAWVAKDRIMRFNPRLPNDTATLLQLAVFIIALVGIALAAPHGRIGHHLVAVSTVASVTLLVVYAAWLIPYVRLGLGTEQTAHATPRVGMTTAIVLLFVAGTASAFVSDWFVAALTPAMAKLHLSDAFAGLVIVAIAGNAVENVAGVVLAAKGQSDLAVSVVKNSVAQIATFLFPVLVLVSLFFSPSLTFAMPPLLIGALVLTAVAVWQITGDGEAALFEGLALIALYVVVATITLYAG